MRIYIYMYNDMYTYIILTYTYIHTCASMCIYICIYLYSTIPGRRLSRWYALPSTSEGAPAWCGTIGKS